jgi:hypothetical protein
MPVSDDDGLVHEHVYLNRKNDRSPERLQALCIVQFAMENPVEGVDPALVDTWLGDDLTHAPVTCLMCIAGTNQ